MKLEDVLNAEIKMMILRDVKCQDKTCDSRGYYVRCYLTNGKDGCKYFMLKYKKKR